MINSCTIKLVLLGQFLVVAQSDMLISSFVSPRNYLQNHFVFYVH